MKSLAWPHPPTPGPDELLSSFLVRVALRYGMSPTRFCALHFPQLNVWNRDIDRSATDEFLQSIATKSGLPLALVSALTMRDFIQHISPEHPPNHRRMATQRWVNVVSHYHRICRGYGLQYCPACLTESGYYRRTWRISYWTTCPLHHTPLADNCPACGSPIMPHRHHISLLRCHRCGCHLQQQATACSPTAHESSSVRALAERFQLACDSGFDSQTSTRLSSDVFLAGSHFLLRLACLWDRKNASKLPHVRASEMEHCRVVERERRLVLLTELLQDWPQAFLQQAHQHNATQRSLLAVGRPPAWIALAAETLPPGTPHRVRRWSSLRSRLRALQRRKPPGWRTGRAEILLQMGNQ